jgi:protein-L-isoaspartate(D-aspartate) O-methyltransferase
MNFADARLNMVDSQVRPNGITDSRVIGAMLSVRREDFVPAGKRAVAYADAAIALANGDARQLMAPMDQARMLQAAAVAPDSRVLIVGAGTGYGAALASMLAEHVVAIEQDEALAGQLARNVESNVNVTPLHAKHVDGHADSVPYDVILVEGRLRDAPETLLKQLKDGGRLVCGIGPSQSCRMIVMTLTNGHVTRRSVFDVSLSELPGFPTREPAFVF